MSTFPGMDKGSLNAKIARGDVEAVEEMITKAGSRIDVDKRSADGFAPLCIASFLGYADIVKLILQKGADVNVTNSGTGWTPCHCAASQGHGKCLLYLMQQDNLDLTIKDAAGRLASDFGSVSDFTWPFFAAKGCKRTSKAELIRMEIVQKKKIVPESGTAQRHMKAHFSRPGSAYVVQPQVLHEHKMQTQNAVAAFAYGDVLREDH